MLITAPEKLLYLEKTLAILLAKGVLEVLWLRLLLRLSHLFVGLTVLAVLLVLLARQLARAAIPVGVLLGLLCLLNVLLVIFVSLLDLFTCSLGLANQLLGNLPSLLACSIGTLVEFLELLADAAVDVLEELLVGRAHATLSLVLDVAVGGLPSANSVPSSVHTRGDGVFSGLVKGVELALHAAAGVTSCVGDCARLEVLLGVRRGAAQVGFEEEAHEEDGERCEVDQIDVDGESLAGGVDARNGLVLSAVEGLLDCLVRVEEVMDRVVGRNRLSSNDLLLLLLLANWNRLTRDGDVLSETFVTSCAVN